ncbi:MAG: hypothetical protein LBI37_02700 [Puniceicoccales bacterium]|jgi:hypothetical protein|nr:hypothetical protein [Puniceicoccales bacterium]
MSVGGANNNNFNYSNLSWGDKRQILADAKVGNCFTRLFLSTKLGAGRSGLKAAMGASTTINTGGKLNQRTASRAENIINKQLATGNKEVQKAIVDLRNTSIDSGEQLTDTSKSKLNFLSDDTVNLIAQKSAQLKGRRPI